MSKAFEKHIVTSNVKRTVCEVLREIYWGTEDVVIREKVQEAIGMAKRMDAKLRIYKADWEQTFYENVQNPKEVAEERRVQYEAENSRVDVRKG